MRDLITILIWQYTLLDYVVLLSSDCIALGASEKILSVVAASTLIHSLVGSPIHYC